MPMKDSPGRDLKQTTKDILASYEADERTRRIGETFLPSRSMIVEILDETRQLLFPGYFGQKKLTRENIEYHVGNLLDRLGSYLTDQICYCLCSEGVWDDSEGLDPCREKAAEIAYGFLARIPKIRRMLALDVQAAYDGDPAAKSIDEVIYCYPGFYAVTVYRIAHELADLKVPLMPRIMTEYAHSVTGVDIHPNATIGKRFFIDHATGVVVGETTRIGDDVKIYQGVTLGAQSFPKDERGRVIKGLQRHPTIEDKVTIYANATILGGETVVGEGVTVAGNTFVTDSVSAGSLVAQQQELHVKTKGKSEK